MEEFILKKPFFEAMNGEETKFDRLAISQPNGKCRTALFQLKQHFEKAKIDLSILSAKMTEGNNELSREIEKAQQELGKKEETMQDKINSALSILYSGGADIDACTNALISVLKLSAKFNDEFQCNSGHFDEMTCDDIEQLLGFYLVNFM